MEGDLVLIQHRPPPLPQPENLGLHIKPVIPHRKRRAATDIRHSGRDIGHLHTASIRFFGQGKLRQNLVF